MTPSTPSTLVLLLVATFLTGVVLGGVSVLAGLIAERWIGGRSLPRRSPAPPGPELPDDEPLDGGTEVPRRGFSL